MINLTCQKFCQVFLLLIQWCGFISMNQTPQIASFIELLLLSKTPFIECFLHFLKNVWKIAWTQERVLLHQPQFHYHYSSVYHIPKDSNYMACEQRCWTQSKLIVIVIHSNSNSNSNRIPTSLLNCDCHCCF